MGRGELRLFTLVALTSPLAMLACEAFSGSSTEVADPTEAGVRDAALEETGVVAPTDAAGPGQSDAARPGDAGLYFADDFELDMSQCNGWESVRSDLTLAVGLGRTGSMACRVCPRPGATISTIVSMPLVFATGDLPGTYDLSFWARAENGLTSGNGGIQPYAADGSNVGGNFPTDKFLIESKNWARIQVPADVAAQATSVRVQGTFAITADAGPCVLVDDVTFTRRP